MSNDLTLAESSGENKSHPNPSNEYVLPMDGTCTWKYVQVLNALPFFNMTREPSLMNRAGCTFTVCPRRAPPGVI